MMESKCEQKQPTHKRKREDVDLQFQFELPFDSTASGPLEEQIKRDSKVTTCFWSTATPLQDDDVEETSRTLYIMTDHDTSKEHAEAAIRHSTSVLKSQCDTLLTSIHCQLEKFPPDLKLRKPMDLF